MERWRKPVIPAAVSDDPAETLEAGLRRGGVNWTLTEEDIGRVKAGYVCLKCMEPQEVPFPKVCSLPGCGYPIEERQLIDLEDQDQGEKWLGSHIDIEEELDRLDEKNYRDFHWAPEHHMIVPKSVKK